MILFTFVGHKDASEFLLVSFTTALRLFTAALMKNNHVMSDFITVTIGQLKHVISLFLLSPAHHLHQSLYITAALIKHKSLMSFFHTPSLLFLWQIFSTHPLYIFFSHFSIIDCNYPLLCTFPISQFKPNQSVPLSQAYQTVSASGLLLPCIHISAAPACQSY